MLSCQQREHTVLCIVDLDLPKILQIWGKRYNFLEIFAFASLVLKYLIDTL